MARSPLPHFVNCSLLCSQKWIPSSPILFCIWFQFCRSSFFFLTTFSQSQLIVSRIFPKTVARITPFPPPPPRSFLGVFFSFPFKFAPIVTRLIVFPFSGKAFPQNFHLLPPFLHSPQCHGNYPPLQTFRIFLTSCPNNVSYTMWWILSFMHHSTSDTSPLLSHFFRPTPFDPCKPRLPPRPVPPPKLPFQLPYNHTLPPLL